MKYWVLFYCRAFAQHSYAQHDLAVSGAVRLSVCHKPVIIIIIINLTNLHKE